MTEWVPTWRRDAQGGRLEKRFRGELSSGTRVHHDRDDSQPPAGWPRTPRNIRDICRGLSEEISKVYVVTKEGETCIQPGAKFGEQQGIVSSKSQSQCVHSVIRPMWAFWAQTSAQHNSSCQDTHTLLYIRQITNKNLLYCTGYPAQFSVITYMGKESEKECIYVCV